MYRNVFWKSREKCIALRTWDKEGKRISIDVPYKPYLYIKDEKGTHKSIFGDKLVKKQFNNLFDRNSFLNDYKNIVFENFDVENQFLLDLFYDKSDKSDFTKNPLRILMFDIEVDPISDGSFPKPELALAEINIITVYDSLLQRYKVFSKNEYTGNGLIDKADFVYCKNEEGVLLAFLDLWRSNDYPDIVTAWNLNGFDMEYVSNRMIKILGVDYFNSLSPYGIIRKKTIDKNFKTYTKYDIAGVTVLDMLDVYQKFKIVKQESYKLDFIANMELGVGKIDYGGLTIYEFMEKDWNKFVEYNVRDVELMVRLEKKTNYFKILRMICNIGCINYEDGLGTIKLVNSAIDVIARRRGQYLPYYREKSVQGEKPGGFVMSNSGIHKDVVTFDAGSLYPNLIITCNISLETKVGVARFGDSINFFDNLEDGEATFTLTSGKVIKTTKKAIYDMIRLKEFIICPNGCVFRQDFRGIFPEFMQTNYSNRQNVKKRIKENNKEIEKCEKEIEELKKLL